MDRSGEVVFPAPPDRTFHRVATLAAHIFDVPVAVVRIVDPDSVWLRSLPGTGSHGPDCCLSASAVREPWVVGEAGIDPESLANPLVAGGLGFRFFAAAPLMASDGYQLGTLCVIDREQRACSDAEREILNDLAAIVVDELELRLAAQRTLACQDELRLQAERARQAAEAAALSDPLTGTRNRRALAADLEIACAEARRSLTDVALVMIDVDGLKRVNDQQGHPAGDRLLCRFARALADSFRTTDRLYRLGGDEFAILMPIRSGADAQRVERRVQAAVDATRAAGFGGMGASVGTALVSEAGGSGGEALALADRRMYLHKSREGSPGILSLEGPVLLGGGDEVGLVV